MVIAMTWLDQLMSILNGQMTRPVPYGSLAESWFHYLALIVSIVATIVSLKYLKNGSEKRLKRFLLGYAIFLLSFELYKQLIFSYQAGWGYQWYIFPFQFCSTPMYVALIAGLTKNAKLRQTLVNFLGTYGLFGGLAAMVYPNDVFVTTVGINIQTMVHHGTMMVCGIALLWNHVKLTQRSIYGAVTVFSVLVTIAIVLNFIHNTWIAEGTFNMFFINPKFNNHLPILTQIEPLVPHFVFVGIYIVGFALIADLMLWIGIGLKRLATKTQASSSLPFAKASK